MAKKSQNETITYNGKEYIVLAKRDVEGGAVYVLTDEKSTFKVFIKKVEAGYDKDKQKGG